MPHSCSRLFRRVSSFALLACVALHFTASLAPAAILTATIPGSPNWRGDGPFTIGTRFTVGASPIDINSLGVMIRPGDNGGNFYSSGVLVGLWDNSGNLLRTTQVLQAQVNDRVDNGYAYVLVAPITLSAGATYRIGAVVGSGRAFFLDSYPSTSFAAGPGVTQNQSVFNSGATLTFPNSDGAVTGRWGAANATLLTAGTSTWNGGSGSSNNLTDNANWGGADLKAGDHLVFAGSTRTTPNNNILANTGFSSITFNSGAGSFTLGGNAINLLGNVVNNSTNLQTINTALVLDGATRTFDAASGNITVGGAISQANGTHGLIKNGTGTLTLTSSASTFAGGGDAQ